jgi:formylglycine-generating enzyme required for sulfatase activity
VRLSAAASAVAESPEAARTLPAVTARGATFELVRIPSGEFQMGSENDRESPRHRVQVRGFDLGRTEVTIRQFRAFTQATGYRTDAEKQGCAWVCCWSKQDGISWRNPGFAQSEDDPVVALSWFDAVEFCKWLAAETGQQFRLASEAEWEYAARAGDTADLPSELGQAAWYKDNSEGRTHPVAGEQPNAWGLYDVLGNAWEWVADVWSDDYTGAPADGTARLDGGYRRPGLRRGRGAGAPRRRVGPLTRRPALRRVACLRRAREMQ